MKKFLLLVCVFPCLLSAQNATVKNGLKEKTSIQQVMKSLPANKLKQAKTNVDAAKALPAEMLNRVKAYSKATKSLPEAKQNQTVTYAGTENLLPDSVYTYADEACTELVSKSYFKYNEKGWPVVERTVYSNENYDWETNELIIAEYEYKYEYDYSFSNGQITMKITEYDSEGKIRKEGGIVEYVFWEEDFIAFFTSQKSFELLNDTYLLEMNIYYFDEDEDDRYIPIKLKATAFNPEGRPTEYDYLMLDYDYDDEADEYIQVAYLLRAEAEYNENGLMSSISIYAPTGDPDDPWVWFATNDYFYNDALQLVKSVFADSEGDAETDEYEYNEKGLLIKEASYFVGNDSNIYEYKYDEQGNVVYVLNYWKYSSYDEENDENYVSDGEEELFLLNFYPDEEDEDDDSANEVIIQSAVYPNPVSDVLNVRIAGADNALITIFSMNGSRVFQQTSSQPVVSIPVQSFVKGYYLLTIQTGAWTKSHKVLIR